MKADPRQKEVARRFRKLTGAFLALVFTGISAWSAQAETRTLTDIVGRKVEFSLPVERVLIGEARQMSVVAALKGKEAFDRVVGWRNDLLLKDADTYAAYLKVFPHIADLPQFGYIPSGTFDLEAAIALRPDILTLNLEAYRPAVENGLIQKAEAAGIAVVVLDFRVDADRNTEPSIALLGDIFGAEKKASEFIAYRRAQLARVEDTLAKAKPEKPLVFIERAPGISGDIECCRTFGSVNFGEMIERAGGENLGSQYLGEKFGSLNPELLVAANPDHIVVTGSNWAQESDIHRFVNVGPSADMAEARKSLAALMDRPAFRNLQAVSRGHVHAIWHQFYGTPFDFIAIQKFAAWFHPDLFPDLDANATFREMYERFMPFAYEPGYFISLDTGIDNDGRQ